MERLPVPLEIRQQIYSNLLTYNGHITFELTGSEQDPFIVLLPPAERPSLGLHPAILRVNRATSAEAAATLYSCNRFRLSYVLYRHPRCPSIAPFFRLIGGATNAALLRHVCVRLVALVRQVLHIDGVWRAALLSDDQETVDVVRQHCPGLKLCEVWILPQSGQPRRRLSVGDWHDGTSSREEELDMKWRTIDEFVLVYSRQGSEFEKCSMC